jgi:hypothetical protein
MKILKKVVLSLIIIGSLFFLFGPEIWAENFQFEEFLSLVPQADVIIIFNSGGWGNTPLEKAEDFAPIIEGMEKSLKDFGYSSLVIPYTRTKDDFFGKITGVKDFLNSFNSSSETLAEKVEFLTEKFPDKKIIVTGLSAGGALANETFKKISEETQGSVYGIVAGTPFWDEKVESENVLYLDNNGQDILAAGDIKSLIFSLFFRKDQITIGHWYSWDSPEVGSQIVAFLKNKFR